MKIAIFGNGKMGKKISQIAQEKGHKIVCIADSKKPVNSTSMNNAEVAIEFSTPDSAFENIKYAIQQGIPIVAGTTGWLEKIEEIKKICIKHNGTFLYASNFSLGVNIFFIINEKIAQIMKMKNYDTILHEIHHKEKLDSPSGTAITIAQKLEKILNKKISISSERVNKNPGTHLIRYSSKFDKIELKHSALNRDGFALGAIMAAEWIKDKKGIFEMSDVIHELIY
jgi:4-hydroxy-tetrahydrodipicolinate reductase